MLTVLVRGEGDQFQPAEATDLPHLVALPDRLVWVDLEDPTDDEVRVLSGVFHFHQLTIDDCLNPYVDPPKADDYGAYLFLVMQGIDYSTTEERVQTTELDIYLGRSYVVTFHRRPLAAVKDMRDRCRRAAPLPARGADWLAHALLDTLVDHLLPVVETLDERISDLEDEALRHPDPALVPRLLALKRSVLRLRRLAAPQRDVINRLSRGDFAHLLGDDTRMHFRDIYDHLVRLEDLVETLRDLGDSVISTYLATVNNRMNDIMKTLSIVGTVFLPLTLVASIFGTNFVPTYEGAGWWGFGGMVAVFLVIAAGLFLWFHRRRWL
ncbi:MAG: magnesium/cobalt transporter CorA [Dehalococcoidia bacterium]